MKLPTSSSAPPDHALFAPGRLLLLGLALPASATGPLRTMELFAPDRPWEFLSSVGQRAGMFGNEAGNFEAWVTR